MKTALLVLLSATAIGISAIASDVLATANPAIGTQLAIAAGAPSGQPERTIATMASQRRPASALVAYESSDSASESTSDEDFGQSPNDDACLVARQWTPYGWRIVTICD